MLVDIGKVIPLMLCFTCQQTVLSPLKASWLLLLDNIFWNMQVFISWITNTGAYKSKNLKSNVSFFYFATFSGICKYFGHSVQVQGPTNLKTASLSVTFFFFTDSVCWFADKILIGTVFSFKRVIMSL